MADGSRRHVCPANVDAGLQPLDPEAAYVRIAHVASTGSTYGLNLINFGPQASGQVLEIEIIDSELFENVLGISEGMRIGNIQGAHGSTVNARMSGNVVWGQRVGLLIVNNRTIASTVDVVSSGNRFYGNAAGTIVVGGLSSNNVRADGNTITVAAHGDRFLGNTGASDLARGGLFVLGSENISDISGGGRHNTVFVRLWGCGWRARMSRTSRRSVHGGYRRRRRV